MSEERIYRFTFPCQRENLRLDVWLAGEGLGLSRSRIQRLFSEGRVRINDDVVTKVHQKPRKGDRIEVVVPQPIPTLLSPEPVPLQVVYEDNSLVVVNKPAGMVVHPGAGNPSGTLVNALLHHCSDLSGIGGVERPGIVHRLDKETSGLLVAAKDDFTHRSLAGQWERRSIERRYLTLIKGQLLQKTGKVEASIGRHPIKRKRMAVVHKGGKVAITEYQVLERFARFTFLEVHLRTGRTHQIRVHLAYLGHPVAGDNVYGRRLENMQTYPAELAGAVHRLQGMALHAVTLGFVHPKQNVYMEFQAPIPSDFVFLLQTLRHYNGSIPSSIPYDAE
jgi:23S rRNA pseudouridine1911/1915/1917 synthase